MTGQASDKSDSDFNALVKQVDALVVAFREAEAWVDYERAIGRSRQSAKDAQLTEALIRIDLMVHPVVALVSIAVTALVTDILANLVPQPTGPIPLCVGFVVAVLMLIGAEKWRTRKLWQPTASSGLFPEPVPEAPSGCGASACSCTPKPNRMEPDKMGQATGSGQERPELDARRS